MKTSFICIIIKNHFRINGFALSLALKARFFGTRKWPILDRKIRISIGQKECRFFLRFGLRCPQVFGEKVTENASLQKRSPEWRFFTTWLLVCVCTDENGGFGIWWYNTLFITTITHALWGMLSYFHCLAFSETIWRIRCVLTRIFLKTEGKKYPFSKTSGYVWTGPRSLHTL